MKTITIDFDLYQKELREKEIRAHGAAVRQCLRSIGIGFEDYKSKIEGAYQCDDKDFVAFLNAINPHYKAMLESEPSPSFTEDEIPF